jgi:hypothetical protein
MNARRTVLGPTRGAALLAAGVLLAGCSASGGGTGAASDAASGPPTASATASAGTAITSGEIQPWTQPEDPDSIVGLPPLRGVPTVVAEETVVLTSTQAQRVDSVEVLNGKECIGRVGLEPRCEYRLVLDPIPGDVAPGSVLVAGVTDATPTGLLVRVDAVEGSTIRATEASLGDAITSGEFRAQAWLEPDDVVKADLAPGVTALPEAVELGRGSAARAGAPSNWLSQGLAWHYAVDESPAPGVHLEGEAHFNAACGMDAGISLTDGPWFWAGCYLQQGTGLDVAVAKGAAGVGQTFTLADFDLEPIVFTIGPVPIVVVPHLTLAVRIDGSLEAGIDLGAEERVIGELKVGYDDGFFARATFDADSDSHHDVPGAGVGSKLGGELGAELMLYGIVGPKIWAIGHVEFTGGPDSRPTVCYDLRGGLGVSLVLDLKVDSWEWRPGWIIDKRLDQGCRSNEPPAVTISFPAEGQSITMGGVLAAELTAKATNPEDGALPVRWSSDLDGALGEGVGPVKVGFRTIGTHTLTATATDREGATGKAVVHVTIAKPTWSLALTAATLSGAAIDVSDGVLEGVAGKTVALRAVPSAPAGMAQPTCDLIRWRAALPLQDLGSCRAKLTLATAGTTSVSASMVTPWGDTVSKDIEVQVAAAPTASPSASAGSSGTPTPPAADVDFEGITATTQDGQSLEPDGITMPVAAPVRLVARLVEPVPANVTATFAWSVRKDGGPWEALDGPAGNPSVREFTYSGQNSHTFTFRCIATASTGQTTTMSLDLRYLGLVR